MLNIQKFRPTKFKIKENTSAVGSFVRSTDEKLSGHKLNKDTGCGSYHNDSSVGSCYDTCKESNNCPIWRTRKE